MKRARRRVPYRNRRFAWLHDRFGWFFSMSRKKQILLLAGLVTGVLAIIAIITTVVFAASLSSKESIMNRNKTGVSLLDRNDRVFYEFNNAHSDTYVPLSDISPLAQQALIAAEDKDFYSHAGFSIPGIVNAVYKNLISVGDGGGGSTITQQLVKNALLTQDRNFLRKYQELILSIEIERRYDKNEILEMYLNSTYFGEGAFGIEDAAQAYFSKSAKDLNVAQAGMLIGLLPAPSAYSPISGNIQFAKERQEYVLGRMQEDGVISEAEADAALAEELAYNEARDDTNKAPHFALMVKKELEEKYGEERIARSGYKVKTTINLDWQEQAQSIVASQVDRLALSRVSNGGLVAIDPRTGEILALVGSKDWNNEAFGKFNITTATRQPGSSFKPIVYGTGIEQRVITAATIFEDKPTDFGGYRPQNYNGRFNGDVTTRYALANSLNIPAVLAIQKVGIQEVIDQAEDLGITTLTETPEHYGLPLALGSGQIKLLELTNAYATLANSGKRHDVQSIISITDKNDKQIFKSNAQSRSAISEQTAYIMSSILSDNGAREPTFGGSLTLAGGRPAAVKTGTTEDYRDALTVGYTPSLAVGVWIGNNDNSPMSSIAGASGSGPIWRQFMQQVLGNSPFEQFTQPSGVVALQVCRGSEAIAQAAGPNTFTEYFRATGIPSQQCTAEVEPPKEEVKPEEEEEVVEPEEEEIPPTDEETGEDEEDEDPTPGDEETPGEEDELPLPPVPPPGT